MYRLSGTGSTGATIRIYIESYESDPKLYPVEGGIDLSSCRLCECVGDSRYCKNLFREANRDILDFVQQVYLSQLVCRSCEIKVKTQ